MVVGMAEKLEVLARIIPGRRGFNRSVFLAASRCEPCIYKSRAQLFTENVVPGVISFMAPALLTRLLDPVTSRTNLAGRRLIPDLISRRHSSFHTSMALLAAGQNGIICSCNLPDDLDYPACHDLRLEYITDRRNFALACAASIPGSLESLICFNVASYIYEQFIDIPTIKNSTFCVTNKCTGLHFDLNCYLSIDDKKWLNSIRLITNNRLTTIGYASI